MRRQIQTLAIAIAIAAATGAVAQTNPLARGSTAQQNSFYFSAIKSNQISSPLGSSTNQVTRPTAAFGPVTPVPEPSEWGMLLAGLALVGFIVRRNATRQ